jgi:hypothetical protein
MKSVAEKSISAIAKARSRVFNLWHHDVAERMKIRRRGIARDAGLDDSYDVGTFPPQIVVAADDSRLKGVLMGAAMAAALGSGGFALSHFLGVPEKEVVEKVIEKVFDSDIDMEIVPP